MTDTKRLLARIGTARDAISRKEEQTSLDYMIEGVLMECSVALKETNMVEVVRCKDCKHGEQCNQNLGEFYLCGKDIGTFETSVHKADWYCADGERKDS